MDKKKLNALARLFYQAQGYQVIEGYDFSKAHHPAEKSCWNQAVIAWKILN